MIEYFLLDKKLVKLDKIETLKGLKLNENLILLSFGVGDLSAFFDERALNVTDSARWASFKGLRDNQSFINSRALMIKAPFQSTFSSLSHKKELVLRANADFNIGVDIEILVPRKIEAALELGFNAFEHALIKSASEPLRCFYELYTLKEALLKFANFGFDRLDKVGLCENLALNLEPDLSLKTNLKACLKPKRPNLAAFFENEKGEKLFCSYFTSSFKVNEKEFIFSVVYEN